MNLVNSTAKMAKQATKWRQSASLIILSKDCQKTQNGADYKECENEFSKVLLFSRSEKASFMPTSSVFPGGVREDADESPLWLQHFQNFGINEQHFQKLIIPRRPDIEYQPNIFKTEKGNWLHKDISLRITAIRETFEEMGIMVCRDRQSLAKSKTDFFGSFHENFDRLHWQHVVHNDPMQFLNLCKELDVVPDVWSLTEWSAWLTPSVFKKRFETAFYLVSLPTTPNVILETNEGTDYQWITPKDALKANLEAKIWLPPPQCWELSRLLNFNSLSEVQKFAFERQCKSTMLMLPVQHRCTDGLVSLFPGDSSYPEDPNASDDAITVNMTLAEFRAGVERVHRYEFQSPNENGVFLNFQTLDGHLKPVHLKMTGKL